MSDQSFKLLGKEILPGQTVQFSMEIARLHTHTAVEVPVVVSRGKKNGPTILLNAGIHGDEVNGVEIVRQIITKGYHKPEAGTVICIPVLNVFGFLHKTREFPDGRDLNRVFPGSKDGSLASRFAYYLMTEIIPHVDYCIDYHTGASDRFNFSHLRLEGSDAESMELAKQFGCPFILLSKELPKSFRSEATKKGVKTLLFEGGKSLDFNRTVTEVGVTGALRVMQYLGLRDFKFELDHRNYKNDPVVFNSSKWIRARYSGMFRTKVKTGTHVSKGSVLGTISDPFGFFERRVLAKFEGVVICSNHSPIVHQGDALFHVAYDN